MNEKKCVIVLDENLPTGVLCNTAAILGVTIGKQVPESVGTDVKDADKKEHLGIIATPIPILKSNKDSIYCLRQKLYDSNFSDVITADFSDVAQCCQTYDDYIAHASSTPETNYQYFGIALYGDKKKVNHLTGSMPLLR